MRATLMYGPGDIRVEDVAEPALEQPTDAIVRIVRSCICGSDLHPYRSMSASVDGTRMGHEFLGVVEDTGREVRGVRKGDLVVASFAFQDNTCDLCRANLQTSCPHGGFFSDAQAEAIRVPLADGTLVGLPGDVDDALLPSLLTLADVYGTGHHAAVRAGVKPGDSVTVIGDGAVGLLAVLSAQRLGAEQIILMGRHRDRTDLGRDFGATDVVAERGAEGIERIRELTGGHGTHAALEAVGHLDAYETALATVRPGGVISRVGVPQYAQGPLGFGALFGRNLTLTGGPAPVRAYIDELLPAVLDGTVRPGRVFDRTIDLAGVPDGYRAMDDREALKVLIAP
ncbi:zinc-dependent alcohol dehydrogenase family protein [Nocardia sp. NBC_00416]|uniref:zinc-dependent alcohol dehydrogenase family protein n=1 Tax=Nocardia sp. NBC_00416 TaxID=2975991 RepID=UPI002E1A74D0